jgi:hypothetical protein
MYEEVAVHFQTSVTLALNDGDQLHAPVALKDQICLLTGNFWMLWRRKSVPPGNRISIPRLSTSYPVVYTE